MADELVEFSPEALERRLRPFHAKYGCLSIMGASGQSRGWGTAIFASHRGRKYIVTAKHVIDKLFLYSGEIDLVIGSQPIGASESLFFRVSESSLHSLSQRNDVAVLDAPDDLQRSHVPQWLDLEDGGGCMPRLRSEWSGAHHPHIIIAAGFARFTNLKGRLDSGQQVEARGAIVAAAQIKSLAPVPDGTPLSVSLMLGSPLVSISEHDPLSPLARLALQAQEIVRSNPASQIEDLQGMSGGPLVVLTEQGEELVGVISRGPPTRPWDQVIRAAPVDEIDLSGL